MAADMQFIKSPTQLQQFCSRRYTFSEEIQKCQDKAMFIGLEKTETCANFSGYSVDREACLAAAGDGTSVEVLRYCASHDFSMKKQECLENRAQEMMSADFQPVFSQKLKL